MFRSMACILIAAILALGVLVIAGPEAEAAQAMAQEQSAPKPAWPPARPGAPAVQPAQPDPQSWGAWLLAMQQKLQSQLAQSVRELKTGNMWLAGAALIGLSFLYGVFHAAGPGHGKAVISSYVVANRTTVRRGIIISFASSAVQALSAIAIVSVLAIGMNAAGLEIRQAVRKFEIVSAALIILAGLWLLVMQVRRYWSASSPVHAASLGAQAVAMPNAHGHDHGHAHHHAHDHGDDCGCGHANMPAAKDLEGNWSLRNAAAIILAVGIRPCTGAILVLIFALTQGMFWAGIAATFAMALGTAITVSALAVLAVGSRETAARFAGGAWADRIYNAAGVAGAVLVILLGVFLLYAALITPAPF